MANYINKRVTIIEDTQERIPVSTILSDVFLNGKKTKELMILTEVDVNNKPIGKDILIKPETVISGL